jgi:glycosyltransferase involved in cell wall biosynthesis
MSARRILIVSDEMEVAGSQRQIGLLLRGLSRERWNADLLFFRKRSFLVDEIQAAGIACHQLRKRGRFDIVFLWRLLRHLRRERYELVHCFSFTAELWLWLIRPFVPRFAFVASVRGLDTHLAAWHWRLKRRVLTAADAIIANAQAGARHVAQYTRIALQRFAVIANGVAVPALLEADRAAALRGTLQIPPNRRVALFAGRLVAEKNASLLLDALACLPPAQRPFVLLAGSGPKAAELADHADRLGLARSGADADLRFLGEQRDLLALIAIADFLIVPSLDEGLSNVILEAMVGGCAVIATQVGGNTELIDDGRSGLLVAPQDVEAFAHAIARLHDDPQLAATLARNARADVLARYSIAQMVEQTEAVYRDCLRGSARRSAGTASASRPNAPLRILFILESHFPARGGGAESQVHTLSQALRARGQRVTVLTPLVRGGPAARVERYRGIVVCRLPFPRARFLCTLVLWMRCVAFLHARRGRYDAWHAHIAHHLAAIACVFGRLYGRIVVVKVSGSWELEQGALARGKGLVAALTRRALARAGVLQAISRRIAANLIAQGFPRARIAVLPNAVDVARFQGRSDAQIRPLTALYLGRLVREKGLDLLLGAWAQAFAGRHDVRLVVVGDGELRPALEAQARAQGIADQVEFHGYRADIETWLAHADFGVLPSTIEGLSNTLLEYMSAGLPVLASRISGSEDFIVTGRNGWLFEPGDGDALAANLGTIAKLPAARLRALGAQARSDVARNAGVADITANLLALYRGATPAELGLASPAREEPAALPTASGPVRAAMHPGA